LIPGLGKLQLIRLTPQKLQSFLNERHAAGLSAATVKHLNATLRAALSQAHRWQLVHQNAAKLATLPRSVRYQPRILNAAQSRDLLMFVRGKRYEGLFTVALTLGLRRSETLGLRWRDIDLERGILNVRHSLESFKGQGLQLSEPKSENAKRELRIPQICLMALLSHRIQQRKEQEWAASKWQEADFVFTTATGTPMHPDNISRVFPTILSRMDEILSTTVNDAR
jgi:integrase